MRRASHGVVEHNGDGGAASPGEEAVRDRRVRRTLPSTAGGERGGTGGGKRKDPALLLDGPLTRRGRRRGAGGAARCEARAGIPVPDAEALAQQRLLRAHRHADGTRPPERA